MEKEFDRRNTGIKGEDAAADFYAEAGYKIIVRNWRWSNKGEIDIIAYDKKENILAVCEVKTRKFNSILRPCEAVNIYKQNKIRTLISVFLRQNEEYTQAQIRFDVIEVFTEDGKIKELNFIKNAF